MREPAAPSHGRCHVLAHDTPAIPAPVSSSLCAQLKKQDSDGFRRIFHYPPPTAPTQLAAQSEPATVIIIAVIII